jgi:transposase-like protein
MKKVAKKGMRNNERKAYMEAAMKMNPGLEARLAAIQALIPLGLSAVNETLQAEWATLVGERYARGKAMGPWGSNRGAVYLLDQKLRVRVPRVRRKDTDEEIPLASYIRLQEPGVIEEMALKRVLNGVSQANYRDAALSVPETFGISRDSVSKKWIRASAKKLETLQTRDLTGIDIVAMILDGKAFGDNEMITALGVTIEGEKTILGFIEASTENFAVCRDFMNDLVKRGLNTDNEILVVMDGGKGLHKGVTTVLGEKAVIARCQWHKRENVVEYLPVSQRDEWRRKLQNAYEAPTYDEAKGKLLALKPALRRINLSAVNSLEEGFEETLTLHRLGLFEQLGVSFKTTNMVENVHRLLEDRTGRVCRWRNSEQRQRWVATALLKIEPRLRRVKGYEHLPALREAMKRLVGRTEELEFQKAA